MNAGKYQLFVISGDEKQLVAQSGHLETEAHLNSWSATEAGKRPLNTDAGERWLLVHETDARYVANDIQQRTANGTSSSGMPPVASPTQTTVPKEIQDTHPAVSERGQQGEVFTYDPSKQPSFAEVMMYEKKKSRERTVASFKETEAIREQLKAIGGKGKTSTPVINAKS